ncbi:hypothetical protein EVAR_14697_1 [Eumeta japonica]|uniref:Uncharacterized protein n=1 Tax=Eumeta variegata TaxID=151549 RepID=A0A4C1U2G7_EUMVA|nr:hypothetical protein EVAR_14697_1 [Eumeta japonica]
MDHPSNGSYLTPSDHILFPNKTSEGIDMLTFLMFHLLLLTVYSAPEASALAVLFGWGAANVLTHVASQNKQDPLCHAINVNPSGCLPFERLRPRISSGHGTLAEISVRRMISLRE